MLFNGGSETSRPTTVKASCWFDTPIAERFTVTEQAFSLPNNCVATIVELTNPKMLEM
jgi:hypothetical protein